ncbi:DNA glycosylase [Mrakia frigida]|uniref:endonuclease III domain-containing protein n=1 Tax=Mrakia frigida TaxID=29902 RepID=UPI003FCC22EC
MSTSPPISPAPRSSKRALHSASPFAAMTSAALNSLPTPSPKKKPKVSTSATPKAASSSSSSSSPKKEKKASASPKKAAAFQKSPYPTFVRPTAQDCQLVTDRLAAMHGLPTRKVMGTKIEGGGMGEACGGVPSVLDALVRTILSQNTTNTNSSRAYASLLDTFGPSPKDPKAVDLVKIYRSSLTELAKSIQCGGLANVKSKAIRNVLIEVRERNVSRVADPSSSSSSTSAVKKEEDGEAELSQAAQEKLLSLDYVHGLSDELAMKELESFKGVGPKTASCVLLFCLARDSFAVDTHVFRLSQQLGWVPAKATRQSTYEHLDVRIPAELRYPLHVLLIAHGKSCTRCAASKKTSRPSLGPCPLLGLSDSSKGAKTKSPRKGKGVKTEEDTDSEALTEPESSGDEGETLVAGKKKEEEDVGLELGEEAKEQASKDVEEAVRIAHGG